MNMKKLFAFITMIAVVLTGTVFADAAEPAESAAPVEYSSNVREAIALIEYLEVLKLNNDEKTEVSRADFAVYTARLMEIDEYAKMNENNAYYYDVPASHWSAASVNGLTEFGILSVGDDKMFRPDDTITLEEATKIMLAVLGYKGYAEIVGGYPAGYMATANKLRLHEGMSGSKNLTKIDAIVLLANAANTVVMDALPYKDASLFKQSGESWLNRYRDIYAVEGRLETVNETSIYPDGALNDAVMIDGIIYNYNGSVDFVGQKVKAYYIDTNGSNKTIALIVSKMKESDVLEIPAEDLVRFSDDYKLTYYDEKGKTRTVSIEKNAAVIYNGICADTNVADLINGANEGTVTVLRSSRGAYDTLIVRHSETVVVGYIDVNAKKLYDSADKTRIFDMSDDSLAVKIYDESGNEMDFSAIGKNSVLSVFENPGKRIEVWVSNSNVEGTYKGEMITDEKKYIIINDAQYEVDAKYYPEIKKQLVMSQDATFLLNIYGKVAGISDAVESNDYSFGYYIAHTVEGGLDRRVLMKLYTAANGVTGVMLSDKVIIDGTAYKNDAILPAWETAYANAQAELEKFSDKPENLRTRAIRYKLNRDNEIVEIDTPFRGERESENSLRISIVQSSRSDYIFVGIIGKSITFNKNTALFQVPGEELIGSATDKMFSNSVGLQHNPGNGHAYIAYKTSSESGASDLIVQVKEVSVDIEISNHIMFDKVTTSLDEEGYEVNNLVGWSDGREVKYTISSDVENDQGQPIKVQDADIEKGDLLLLAFNAANEVVKYCKVYDWREEQTYPTSVDKVFTKDGHDFYSGKRMTFGYVKHKYADGVMEVSYTKGGDFAEAYPVSSSMNVTVFDRNARRNTIYKGSIADIAAFDEAGSNCSPIVVYAEFAQWKSCYVYK